MHDPGGTAWLEFPFSKLGPRLLYGGHHFLSALFRDPPAQRQGEFLLVLERKFVSEFKDCGECAHGGL